MHNSEHCLYQLSHTHTHTESWKPTPLLSSTASVRQACIAVAASQCFSPAFYRLPTQLHSVFCSKITGEFIVFTCGSTKERKDKQNDDQSQNQMLEIYVSFPQSSHDTWKHKNLANFLSNPSVSTSPLVRVEWGTRGWFLSPPYGSYHPLCAVNQPHWFSPGAYLSGDQSAMIFMRTAHSSQSTPPHLHPSCPLSTRDFHNLLSLIPSFSHTHTLPPLSLSLSVSLSVSLSLSLCLCLSLSLFLSLSLDLCLWLLVFSAPGSSKNHFMCVHFKIVSMFKLVKHENFGQQIKVKGTESLQVCAFPVHLSRGTFGFRGISSFALESTHKHNNWRGTEDLVLLFLFLWIILVI